MKGRKAERESERERQSGPVRGCGRRWVAGRHGTSGGWGREQRWGWRGRVGGVRWGAGYAVFATCPPPLPRSPNNYCPAPARSRAGEALLYFSFGPPPSAAAKAFSRCHAAPRRLLRQCVLLHSCSSSSVCHLPFSPLSSVFMLTLPIFFLFFCLAFLFPPPLLSPCPSFVHFLTMSELGVSYNIRLSVCFSGLQSFFFPKLSVAFLFQLGLVNRSLVQYTSHLLQ